MKNKGFTLIELLVVISIIALLLSIVMPAMNVARDAARVAVCAANSKQISLLVFAHRADNKERMPFLLNRYCTDVSLGIPAKYTYTSLAFKDYWGAQVAFPNLKAWDIYNRVWNHQTAPYTEYTKLYMPKFFVCPFNQKADPNAPHGLRAEVRSIKGHTMAVFGYSGYTDTYAAWHGPWAKGPNPGNAYIERNPLSEEPAPKYGALVWYPIMKASDPYPYLRWSSDPEIRRFLLETPVRWGRDELARVRAGSLAEAMILKCERGEFLATAGSYNPSNIYGGVYNYNSHRKQGRGGSNVLFADGHIEWIRGSQLR